MIKYSLICKECSNKFDSWFSSSKEFDRLKKLKFLNCNSCGSLNINKSLMAPNLANTKKKEPNETKKFNQVKKKLKEYKNFVEKNFDYVGDNFLYEARSIHYDNKKVKKKGIYGNASSEDIKQLKEEGIETEMIPWIDDKEN